MTAREFVRALDSRECHPTATGRGWSARCPAQIRRLDGQPCRWSARGAFHEAKSYTVPGCTASWPIGLAELRGDTPQVLLVGGGPDLLPACAVLALEDRCSSVVPAAMLGGSARIAPEALALLRGCHVRLVPHVDSAGERPEFRWGNQLLPWAASVDVTVGLDPRFSPAAAPVRPLGEDPGSEIRLRPGGRELGISPIVDSGFTRLLLRTQPRAEHQIRPPPNAVVAIVSNDLRTSCVDVPPLGDE